MTTTSDRVVSRLGELLLIRTERNSRSSLAGLCDPASDFLELDAGLARHLLRHRRELVSWIGTALEAPSAGYTWEHSPDVFLRERLVDWLRQKNQFLHVDDAAERELVASYRRSLLETARLLSSPVPESEIVGGLRDVFAGHQQGLASFVRARLGEQPWDAICAEYSPALQLEALGLSIGTLPGPILDVGCGARAALVRYLRDEGLLAYGIDRDAPEDVAVRTDWLSFPFGTDLWGVVVSHLAFSLHFLHHHLSDVPAAGAAARAHAEAYMRILRSLRVGGVFAYVPGLPFVERLLPASGYRVERVVIPHGLMASAPISAREAAGLSYATHVRRLS